MLANKKAAVDFILDDEGPELNISKDEPGGASRYGISLLALSEYYASIGFPVPTIETLRNMKLPEAEAFYLHTADVIRFDELDSGVDYAVLNAVVTLGPTGGALILQMSADMWPTTAKIDDATIKLANNSDPNVIVNSMCSAWLAWKARSGVNSWAKYGHGWTNRDRRVRGRAMAMVGK